MRFGGLGQLWSTLIKLLSLMFLCQLVSPLVALLAIVVSGTETPDTTWSTDLVSDITQSSLAVDNLAIDSELQTLITSENTISSTATEPSECCHDTGHVSLCPSDHVLTPQLCQDSSVQCSSLPLGCMSCSCDYNCVYGSVSVANCSVDAQVRCTGSRTFTREYRCSYCFLADTSLHKCSNRDIGKFIGSFNI